MRNTRCRSVAQAGLTTGRVFCTVRAARYHEPELRRGGQLHTGSGLHSAALEHRANTRDAQAASDELRLGPLQVPAEDGRRTLRVRLSDEAAIPLPPFMDPIVQQTRTKHERQKSKPKGEGMTALQHDIVNNPYAQIFLTPLRQDALTDLLLPRFFLQSFATAFPQQEKQASKTNAATSPFPFPSSPSSPCPFNPTEEPPLPTRHKPLLIPSSPSTTGQKSHVHLPLTSLEALHSSKRWKVMVPQSLEKTFGVDRKHWSFPLPQARAEMERGCRVGALQALGDLGTGGGLDSIAGGGGEEGDVEGERNVGATGKERAAGNGQETEKRALVVLSPPPDADMAVDQWITEVVSRSSGGRAGKEWCFFLPALLGRDEKGVQRLERFRDWIMESMAEGSGSSLSSTAGDELLAVTFKIEARTMKALLALMRWEMLYSESGRWDIVEKEKLWRRWTDGSRRDGDRASRPLIKP